MGQPIRKVTIVGGGTAGWLAATLIHSAYGKAQPDRPAVEVTLIESPNVPTVGVGEATVPLMAATLKLAAIPEREFFRRCNASFKLGVLFSQWNTGPDGKLIDYFNPFTRVPSLHGASVGYSYLRYGAGQTAFADTYSPVGALYAACKGPMPLAPSRDVKPVGHAFHLDAGKFAELLRETFIARGVTHVLDDMVGVEKNDRGLVAALLLKERGRHPVELVIDCTGFRGLLINKEMGEPFEDYSRYLGNNRALAVQLPHQDPDHLPPITRSTALGAGWVWRVPLYHRVGTGYVFSSAHRTDEEATAEFLAHLGPQGKGAEPRAIPMRIGRTRRPWSGNVVAIGLSSGFIEPLESTAIHAIDSSIRWLISYFPDSDFDDAPRDRFNTLTRRLFDEVRDFICLHYRLGNRTDDPYWIDARQALDVPDSLAENLELWKRTLPATFDLHNATLFSHDTYQAVLLGKRVYDTGYGDRDAVCRRAGDPEAWSKYLKRVSVGIRKAVKDLPDHRTLLTHLRGEAGPYAVLAAGAAKPKTAPQPLEKDVAAAIL